MHAHHELPANGGKLTDRQFCRGDVAIAADVRPVGGIKSKVKILDLSQTGFRMECLTFISHRQVIFVTIPSFQQMEARIEWQTEWMYGCQFACPLHAAIYDHILKTYPALDNVIPSGTTDGIVYGAAAGLRWSNR